MEIQDPNRILRVATHGRGMWERSIDAPTATQLSLVGSQIVEGRVQLSWYASESDGQPLALYRRHVPGDWERIASLLPAGNGMIEYEDADVLPGHSYEYRLGVQNSGGEEFMGQVWVDVPTSEGLALRALWPNPSHDGLTISFVLPNRNPATLQMVDVTGRLVWSRDVTSLGAGDHQVRIEPGAVKSGVYWVRLSQSGRTFSARAAIVQ
jgi:hypothetical protein